MSTTQKETIMDNDLSGRHPINVGHLVMGLALVGLVGVWALIQGDVVDGADIRWLLPVPWVLAGIAGLLATTLSSRERWGSRQSCWVDAPRVTGDAAEAPSYDATTDTDTQIIPTHEENR